MLKPELFSKLVRFAVVGLAVMGVFMGLNWLFALHFGPQVSFLIAYPPALALHYYLNKRWTFGSRRTDTHRQLGEYLVMVGVTFLIQWTVFTILEKWTRLPGPLAAGAANAAQIAVSFVVMQRRVFATPALAK